MFKLSLPKDYSWPVKFDVIDGNGRKQTFSFTATFPRLPQSELDDIMNGTKDGQIDDGALADKVLIGWSGVQDEDGNELAFSEANKAQLLETFPVRPSVIKAWFESLTGAPRKN